MENMFCYFIVSNYNIMSKNIIGRNNNSTNLISLIEETLVESRKIILNILANDYGYDKNSSLKIEAYIYDQTRSMMLNLYNFNDNFIMSNQKNEIDNVLKPSITKYPDFKTWSWIALSIPFYQSLGDTIGYKNGDWEFNYGNVHEGPEYINELLYEFIDLGGVNDLNIKNWLASDDTIMYLATLSVLVDGFFDIDDFGNKIKNAYIATLPLIENRHPGTTTITSLEVQKNIDWNKLPYNKNSIAAGSAMRCGCIGIFYPGTHNRKKLIALSVESSRITHNSTIAILASVSTSLFTAYALERVSINKWPNKLIKILKSNLIDDYIKESRSNDYNDYMRDKILYVGKWEKYAQLLIPGNIPKLDLKFMRNPVQRYKYLIENFSKGCDIPGSCDDALIMAYDSLLRCGGIFEKLIVYSVLHPGDSDTVGSIAFSWFGGLYHSPRNETYVSDSFNDLEFHDKIYDLVEKSINSLVRVYYHDIYLNIAKKNLKKYRKK